MRGIQDKYYQGTKITKPKVPEFIKEDIR